MNEKEYVENVCSNCLNKAKDNDLCNIVKTISGDYRCSNEDVIEEGDYVRTENGEIHKVIEIIKDTDDWNYYKYENCMGDFEINIVKHSKYILDLIEIGDFVDGYKVLDIANSIYKNSKRIMIYKNEKEKSEIWKYIQLYDGKIHTQDDIQTILTHEQYEKNCFEMDDVYNKTIQSINENLKMMRRGR